MSEILNIVKARDPQEREFHQAVAEMELCVKPIVDRVPQYRKNKIFERMIEPERVIMFRVPWIDDDGEIHVNRGYRVQMNSALGPYKGGLRFHPSVTLGIMKFLAFEQTFKNALTTLPIGGGKGGSDFQPKGRSDSEVMRFCQSFMSELFRYIGPNLDVPAGDIGVGCREIGFLVGQYKKLCQDYSGGALTGKGLNLGGSLMRPEATGFGVVYFLEEMLATRGESLKGKSVAISGYGNVGTFVVRKVNELGGKVITLADESGTVHDPDGILGEKWEFLSSLWTIHRKPAQEYADRFGCEWMPGKHPWEVPCDIAIPTATENELDLAAAEELVHNGCRAVVEAANMPCTGEAIDYLQTKDILFGPAKAANAGGVSVSAMEMSQNSVRLAWTKDEVVAKLNTIMKSIHKTCLEAAERAGHPGNYLIGANTAGFIRVADTMLEQGLI